MRNIVRMITILQSFICNMDESVPKNFVLSGRGWNSIAHGLARYAFRLSSYSFLFCGKLRLLVARLPYGPCVPGSCQLIRSRVSGDLQKKNI